MTSGAGSVSAEVDSASFPCPSAPAEASPELPSMAREGAAEYDAGRYAQALRYLQALDSDGSADGISLYRLAYCYHSTGNTAQAQETYGRSRAALEAREKAASSSLEDLFYLVNVLLNERKVDEARAAAQRAVRALETCAVKVPSGGISAFRVGKLYGDAGKMDRQVAWYRRALADFDKDPSPPAAYVSRAAEGVANFELGRGEWNAAVSQLQRMQQLYPADTEILVALLIAQAHSGDVEGAEGTLALLRPIAGGRLDDLVYIKGMFRTLRRMRSSGHGLPEAEPDGRAFSDLTNEELAGSPDPDKPADSRPGLLQAVAQEGREVMSTPADEANAVVEDRGPARKIHIKVPSPQFLERLDQVQGRFLALCLDIVRRGLSLQEIAFTSGISPFVVHDWRDQWIQAHRETSAPTPTPTKDHSEASPTTNPGE